MNYDHLQDLYPIFISTFRLVSALVPFYFVSLSSTFWLVQLLSHMYFCLLVLCFSPNFQHHKSNVGRTALHCFVSLWPTMCWSSYFFIYPQLKHSIFLLLWGKLAKSIRLWLVLSFRHFYANKKTWTTFLQKGPCVLQTTLDAQVFVFLLKPPQFDGEQSNF